MTWKRTTAAAASAMLFAVGGMLVTAPPAAADGPCPANQLCLYDGRNFTGKKIISRNTNACFYPQDVLQAFDSVVSYDNNLPVHVLIWKARTDTVGYTAIWTIRSGGFSSNTGTTVLGAYEMDQICMGNARP